jgi:hypothetical protein
MGAYLYVPYRKVGLGLEKKINLWFDAEDLHNLQEKRTPGINLAVLTAYILRKNWKGSLTIQVRTKGADILPLKLKVEQLFVLARLPKVTAVNFCEQGIEDLRNTADTGDLNISYLKPGNIDMQSLRNNSELLEASFLYTLDSGIENAFA